jgi:large subunit ribosomal protein L22
MAVKASMIRTSPQQAEPRRRDDPRQETGRPSALADLTFSKRRVAAEVKKTLQSAIANAENNHGLDVYDLIVAEAWVGKNLVMKRGRPARPRPLRPHR